MSDKDEFILYSLFDDTNVHATEDECDEKLEWFEGNMYGTVVMARNFKAIVISSLIGVGVILRKLFSKAQYRSKF